MVHVERKPDGDAPPSEGGHSSSPGLADVLRARTAPLHRDAEGSGMVRAILGGSATRTGYVLFLRNLLPAYRALEDGLARHENHPVVGRLHRRELERTQALTHDVWGLAGADWATSLPILPVAEEYAARVAEASGLNPELLVAHAYTRYLGDLGGGPILRSRLLNGVRIPEACLTFHTFPLLGDVRAFALEYRAAIDAAGRAARTPARIVDEAMAAFRLNIELSDAVQRSTTATLPDL